MRQADTHLLVADPAEAIRCFRQALTLFREFRDPYAEASTLAHLGASHHLAGDHAAAGEQWLLAAPSSVTSIRPPPNRSGSS